MNLFRSLAILTVVLASAMTGRATVTTIDFKVIAVLPGTNALILFNKGGSGSGFQGATISLNDSSSNLIATTSLSSSDGLGAAFGPSSQLLGFSQSAVVDNIGALFPLNSVGSIVIQSAGPITFDPLIVLAVLNNGGPGFVEQVSSITTAASVTPEPASILLFGTGLMSIVLLLRKGVLA